MFESFSTSMFRLEARNEYRVPFEVEAFRLFLSGATPPHDDGDREWAELIASHRSAGRLWQKVHVVDLPLSDYVRFEVTTAYDYFSEFGEDVGMITTPRKRDRPDRFTRLLAVRRARFSC